ncbi:MAG: dihydroorotase [Candidatus Omnitrophica bacterium]|jgi:dihydroorotase|nr:dihydroorotase [Candidatus Omnitrophota bacterium]
MKLLIKNGHVISPADNLNEIYDILVQDNKISKIGRNLKEIADNTIDAKDKIVIPGIVDMHVHLREPGREDKETISSGTQAALAGGVTSIVSMPNTLIPIDSIENVKLLKGIIEKKSQANVFICAAITKDRVGRELTNIARFKKEGIVAISDDGASVDNADVMLKALKKAKDTRVTVICHSEDKFLSAGGVVNLGFTSTKMGLRGISKESEYKRVRRDIELAERIDAPIHITHVSCLESVEIIAKAKKKGVKVTADTAPHYFSVSEEAVWGYDTNLKMNPPLRTKEDVLAIRDGLKQGVIDVIASDHAPHTENEKEIEFERAEFGVIGLETELSAAITYLVEGKVLDMVELVKKITINPAKILGINRGTLSTGKPADITVISKDKEWVVRRDRFFSKSKNSAFLGKTLKGVVEYTILGGRIVYVNNADDHRLGSR